MKRISIKLSLRKNYKKKDETYPVCLKVIYDGVTWLYSLDVSVKKQYWNAKSGQISSTCPDSFNLNTIFQKELEQVNKIILDARKYAHYWIFILIQFEFI